MFRLPTLPLDGTIAAPVRSALDAVSPVFASQFDALTSVTQQSTFLQRITVWCALAQSQLAISASGGTHSGATTHG
jgi:hypothetical protein